ncbi:hypothetical protein KJ644_00290, partial [Candidatus Dependentiae bacterium]|nr:hypothetical protein [Candidatus Dependentiae bacterium]
LDVNLNEISIDKIIKENSDVDIEVYELSLEEPHCYFVCDSAGNPILIHNMDQIFMTVGDKAEPIIETVVSTGVTLFGLAKSLGLFDKKKKQEDKKQLPKGAENNKSENKATDKTKKTDDEKPRDKDKPKGKDPIKDGLIEGAEKDTNKKSGRSDIYKKPGGVNRKDMDFDKLKIKKVVNYGNGIKVGYLSDGRTVISRNHSSTKNGATSYPTNELQHADGSKTKVRYY